MSAPKIIKLQANSPLGNTKVPFASNPIPYPEYLYLSMSVFLVSLTTPNRHFSKVGLKLVRVEIYKRYICVLLVHEYV